MTHREGCSAVSSRHRREVWPYQLVSRSKTQRTIRPRQCTRMQACFQTGNKVRKLYPTPQPAVSSCPKIGVCDKTSTLPVRREGKREIIGDRKTKKKSTNKIYREKPDSYKRNCSCNENGTDQNALNPAKKILAMKNTFCYGVCPLRSSKRVFERS